MPIWTPVHHRRNALLIRSNRWWLLLKIKSPASVIRCPDLQLSAQTCDFCTDWCRNKLSASQMIRHPNTRFPKSLLLCCASKTSRSVIKNSFFSFPFKAKFNLGHEKFVISKYKDIWRNPFRKSAWCSYINQSKQGDTWTSKHWLNANSKLNDLVSRRAQLEETGRVSSKQKIHFLTRKSKWPFILTTCHQPRGDFTHHVLSHVVIFSAVIWPDSLVLQLNLSTSSSDLLKCVRARVRAVTKEKNK